jgi:hypothetical protein
VAIAAELTVEKAAFSRAAFCFSEGVGPIASKSDPASHGGGADRRAVEAYQAFSIGTGGCGGAAQRGISP